MDSLCFLNIFIEKYLILKNPVENFILKKITTKKVDFTTFSYENRGEKPIYFRVFYNCRREDILWKRRNGKKNESIHM